MISPFSSSTESKLEKGAVLRCDFPERVALFALKVDVDGFADGRALVYGAELQFDEVGREGRGLRPQIFCDFVRFALPALGRRQIRGDGPVVRSRDRLGVHVGHALHARFRREGALFGSGECPNQPLDALEFAAHLHDARTGFGLRLDDDEERE